MERQAKGRVAMSWATPALADIGLIAARLVLLPLALAWALLWTTIFIIIAGLAWVAYGQQVRYELIFHRFPTGS